MDGWIERGVRAVVGLVAATAGTLGGGALLADERMNRLVAVEVAPITLPAGAAAVERGRALYTEHGCAGCHGTDGAGLTFADDGRGLRATAPNIGRGAGSAVAGYRPVDWVRTLRHGVKPDGRPLLLMPTPAAGALADDDVGALAAYLRSLPPAAGRPAELRLPLKLRVLYGFGLVDDAGVRIDRRPPRTTAG